MFFFAISFYLELLVDLLDSCDQCGLEKPDRSGPEQVKKKGSLVVRLGSFGGLKPPSYHKP